VTSTPLSVEQWKELNADRLVQCRWGCTLTREACRAYQVRSRRYIYHFVGDTDPLCRPNGDYVACLLPEPCPNAISDEESREVRAVLRLDSDSLSSRPPGNRGGWIDEQLVSPDTMLEEADWKRSLVKRP
jgi:hypothetical protein